MLDREIINRVLLNDHVAFEHLIRKYQELVFNTCYRLVKNRADAEDLSQEVFIEVYRSMVHLRNTDDMSGWIYRISYCKCISFLRKTNPAKASSKHDPDLSAEDFNKKAGLSHRKTPQKILEEKEASIELFEKIDQLPPNQKKAILLHKFEGYSHNEICEDMNLSQASVESLIYRAKVTLRKSLVSYFEKK